MFSLIGNHFDLGNIDQGQSTLLPILWLGGVQALYKYSSLSRTFHAIIPTINFSFRSVTLKLSRLKLKKVCELFSVAPTLELFSLHKITLSRFAM